ncbi:unnamed protein product [Staurois parvus]|uniref:Uncharacterized protein n=1 Tax=Staurois parvus TaxID=386267 RepID=A0ABN9F1W6_9NEOB|nr:unnamed protein product [Staurois parvus]
MDAPLALWVLINDKSIYLLLQNPIYRFMDILSGLHWGRTDHLETRALPKGPGSVGGPMRYPWYIFHRLF